MSIRVEGVSKGFGRFAALRDVSLRVDTGTLMALLGPSGSGKTTLLRILAGITSPDSGTVFIDDVDATDLRPGARSIGFVFQNYALFRHMTVFENVAFGLRVQPRKLRPTPVALRERVEDLLSLVRLDHLASRYPDELSGGQRQRVALVRALAPRPRLLLLDEPFGALDTPVRIELRRWLRRIHDEMKLTTIFVTHDQEEALEVADSIVVMNDGRVEQVGSPEAVYDRPASPFVLEFLGPVNRFRALHTSGSVRLLHHTTQRDGAPDGSAGELAYVRTHEVVVSRVPRDGNSIPAIVRRVKSIGRAVRVDLDHVVSREVIEVELPSALAEQLALRAGEQVHLIPTRIRVFGDNDAGGSPDNSLMVAL